MGGVVGAIGSVVSTVVGIGSANRQAKAASNQAAQNTAQIKKYNKDLLALLKEQQKEVGDFEKAVYDDTREYVLDKGLKQLLFGAKSGWDRLALAAEQGGGALELASGQMGEERALALQGMAGREAQAADEVQTRLNLAAQEAGNRMGAIIEKHAATAKEMALRDEATLTEHAGKQAQRAMERRFGVGRVVASEAARGVSGGAATAARLMAKQGAIQQALDDSRLKLDRQLYQLAGLSADRERYRASREVEIGMQREVEFGRLQLQGLRQQNDQAYAEMVQGQGHQLQRQAFDVNRQLASGYLDYSTGVKAGVLELKTKLADIDFDYGVESGKRALEDAYRLERAQIDSKHAIAMTSIRGAYDATMARSQANAAIWQGVSQSASLFTQIGTSAAGLFPSGGSMSSFASGPVGSIGPGLGGLY